MDGINASYLKKTSGKKCEGGLLKYDEMARKMLKPLYDDFGFTWLKNPTAEDFSIDFENGWRYKGNDYTFGTELEVLKWWYTKYPFNDWHGFLKKCECYHYTNSYYVQIMNPELYYHSMPLPQYQTLTDAQLTNKGLIKNTKVCIAYFPMMDFSDCYKAKTKDGQDIYINPLSDAKIIKLEMLPMFIARHQLFLRKIGWFDELHELQQGMAS